MAIIERLVICAAIFTHAAACGGDDGDKPPPDNDAPPSVITPILKAPSRSSAIAITDDRTHVAMVNPDDGTLSVFQTSDNARTAKVPTGGRPQGVVLAADNTTAYVANRDDATVVRVTGIDGGTPAVDATAHVGSEPVALALSPTGKLLFVAELAQSRVSVIDTATMAVTKTIDIDRPRALLVTNNGNQDDSDEQLIVPEFYGTPVAGHESLDDGRTGKVHVISLSDLATDHPIALSPVDSGFHAGGDANAQTVHASPNQLGAIAISHGRIYVTSVSASPQGPTRFDNNVFPVVYVADLATGAEVPAASGGTVNLARKIVDALPTPSPAAPRFIPGDLSDLAFVDGLSTGGGPVAYAIGRAGDVMVRVAFDPTGASVGSTQNKEIDLAGSATLGTCQGPIGVAIDPDAGKAYVNCWVSRRMAVVDLGAQGLTGTFEASTAASGADASPAKGKRFYFTGRARWSNSGANGAVGGEGWSSCGSCHPDGLTDNITWSFNAGPRQTTSQDGTFSHTPGVATQKQRFLNWTAIFDEHHDFERNVRDVSGGLGAITTANIPTDCGQLDKEIGVDLKPGGVAIGGLQQPLKELADDPNVATCGHKDWDDVTNYVKTIEPVHGRIADAAVIARGEAAFVEGKCAKCHGGAGWTVSRAFYTPSTPTVGTLAATAFTRPPFFPPTWMYDNADASKRFLISGQPAIPLDDTGPASAAAGIGQIACALRNVGTFGALGPDDTAALETRIAAGGPFVSQGRGGYNVPSLYGLAMGAPYLHHGQAPTLPQLFGNARWAFHTNAGNANFSMALASGTKLDDLVAYLLSIDATTPEVPVPTDPTSGASFDACPAN